MNQTTADYDSPWKEALEDFFPDFWDGASPTRWPKSGDRVAKKLGCYR